MANVVGNLNSIYQNIVYADANKVDGNVEGPTFVGIEVERLSSLSSTSHKNEA